MSRKRATIIAYRSDRNLWADGPLKCRVFQLFGASSPRVLMSREIPPLIELELDLPFDGGQAYGISVEAAEHRSGWHVMSQRSFLRVDGRDHREVDSTIIRPMLVANDAHATNLSTAFKSIEGQGSPFAMFGAQRFDALRDAAKLAFLNVEAKLRETHVGTRSLLSYVRDIREAAVDRVFLFIAAEAKALLEDSPDFADAPGHGAPADLPGIPPHPDSWKHTKYGFGNVQLSFSKVATPQRISATTTEPCFSVDCDIDLERDLGHAFELIHNQVFKKKTDQTLVYRMLWDQGILPAYELVPPAAAESAARVRVSAGAARPLGRRGPRGVAGKRPARRSLAAQAKPSRASSMAPRRIGRTRAGSKRKR